ncbi:MAG: MotE family protein [Halarcobacter sp.]
MIRFLFITILIFNLSNAQESSTSNVALIKQKIEIKELKKELNNFYNKKEKEYQDRKKELEAILAKIEKEKKAIEDLHNKNKTVLANIKGEIENKTSKIYNKMKPKVAASIFNQMINEGKIEDVFDIIIKLKESNVTSLMKYLSPKNAADLTNMLQTYSTEKLNKG